MVERSLFRASTAVVRLLSLSAHSRRGNWKLVPVYSGRRRTSSAGRLQSSGLCYRCCLHLKMYAFSGLQILNDLDKIVSFRVTGRPKHAHQTLWIDVDSLS
jgi:hypothetical protein